MPNALILGFADSLTHELAVRDAFLTYAPPGWDAEILMRSPNADLADNEHVVDVIVGDVGFLQASELNELVTWISTRPEYDIIIISYRFGATGANVYEALVSMEGRILFLPPNIRPGKTNTTFCGVSNDLTADNQFIECHDLGIALPVSQQNVESFVVPAVAGKVAHLKDAGLTNVQARQALRVNLPATTWDNQSGYGRVPEQLSTVTLPTVEPPNTLRMFDLAFAGNAVYTLFEGLAVDSVRIYMDGTLVFDGNGTKATQSATTSSRTGSRVHYSIPYTDFTAYAWSLSDVGEHIWKIHAVKDGIESPEQEYATTTGTITAVILENYFGVTTGSDDTLPDEEETGEAPDDAVLASPTSITVSRVGTSVTVTPNEVADTIQLYRKQRIEEDWVLVATTTEDSATDTVDRFKNYIYAVKIANNTAESGFSPVAYLAGDQQPAIGGMF